MTEPIARASRPRWMLLAIALAGVGLLVWLVISQRQPAQQQTGPQAATPGQTTDAQSELRQKFERATQVTAARPTVQEKARTAIDEHRAFIEANPDAEEVPGLLNAVGNLYREKLADFEGAAEAYQQLVINHPDWIGTYAVYPQLESCYEALNDHDGLRWLFTLMMERFPPESDLHRYAAIQLKLPVPEAPPPQMWEEPQPEEAAPEASQPEETAAELL